MTRNRRRSVALVLAVCIAAIAAVTAGPSAASQKSTNLSLVAYSTPRIPLSAARSLAFQKTPAGADVKFSQSYGASTDQARAVVQGLPTDIVQLSLAADMNLLVDAKLVSRNWNRNKYNGMVTNSIVTFLVRKGNPKDIKTWDDLVKPGVGIVQPNPVSSGGARCTMPTPGLTRSSQVLMPFGFPLRTRKVTIEFVTMPLYLLRFQFLETQLRVDQQVPRRRRARAARCGEGAGSACTTARA